MLGIELMCGLMVSESHYIHHLHVYGRSSRCRLFGIIGAALRRIGDSRVVVPLETHPARSCKETPAPTTDRRYVRCGCI